MRIAPRPILEQVQFHAVRAGVPNAREQRVAASKTPFVVDRLDLANRAHGGEVPGLIEGADVNPPETHAFVEALVEFQPVGLAVCGGAAVFIQCSGPALTTPGSLYSLMLISTLPERSGLSNSSHAALSTPKSNRMEPGPLTRIAPSFWVAEARRVARKTRLDPLTLRPDARATVVVLQSHWVFPSGNWLEGRETRESSNPKKRRHARPQRAHPSGIAHR